MSEVFDNADVNVNKFCLLDNVIVIVFNEPSTFDFIAYKDNLV